MNAELGTRNAERAGRWRGWACTVNVASLGLWLGAVIMTGAAAVIIFPTVHGMAPTLAGYGRYEGDHWMILAGKVANRVFGWSDGVQIGCALVAVVALVGATVWRAGWGAVGVRWAAFVVLLGCLGFNVVVLRPRMQQNLDAYWERAEGGRNEEAAAFRAAFDADHPVATWTLGATAAMLLVNIGVAGWAASRVERVDG